MAIIMVIIVITTICSNNDRDNSHDHIHNSCNVSWSSSFQPQPSFDIVKELHEVVHQHGILRLGDGDAQRFQIGLRGQFGLSKSPKASKSFYFKP